MKIAIYSDIHDNFHNLRETLNMMKNMNIDEAICLGDFINPGIVKEIIGSEIKTHCIWGNNDGEKVIITRLIDKSKNMTIADHDFDIIERDGKKIALLHHPDFAPALAKSGQFDAVFYGHNHKKHFEKITQLVQPSTVEPKNAICILCNPGEFSGHQTGNVTFAVWDTETNEVGFEEIQNKLLVTD